MNYYYVHTGHKIGLERARRAVALVNALKENGIEVEILVNDFRAGLSLKELGVKDYITIESIFHIDAILSMNDTLFMDTLEDDRGRLKEFCNDFKNVFIIENELIEACSKESITSNIMIDKSYFVNIEKEDRKLFFLGDSDYDKIILNNSEFFKSLNIELLLGNYFFVKYEADLEKIFTKLYEPEEYVELITSTKTVITTSSQCALESKVAGAKVIFIDNILDTIYSSKDLEKYGVVVVDGFNSEKLKEALEKEEINKEDVKEVNIENLKNYF